MSGPNAPGLMEAPGVRFPIKALRLCWVAQNRSSTSPVVIVEIATQSLVVVPVDPAEVGERGRRWCATAQPSGSADELGHRLTRAARPSPRYFGQQTA